MATTPIYGLRYQGPGDAPDGPALGEDLALDVETELARIDADVTDLQNPVRHGCRLRRAVQSIASATPSVISWDTEDEDTDGYRSPGLATTVTIPTGLGGLYAITYRVMVSSLTTAGRCFASINMTSAITGTPSIFRTVFNADEDQAVVSIFLPLLAGDSFTADVYHSQGASRDANSWISCYRIGE